MIIFLLLLTKVLPGLLEPTSHATIPIMQRGQVPGTAGSKAALAFTADAPADNEAAAEAVQQRRNQFVGLVKKGLFERFDDAKQEAVFKRNDPSHSVHEPGPLEDEAIASAARAALVAVYAKIGLKPRLTCTSGKLSIDNLPDDPAVAASVVDAVLGLDGVQTVAATLPSSLRMPDTLPALIRDRGFQGP